MSVQVVNPVLLVSGASPSKAPFAGVNYMASQSIAATAVGVGNTNLSFGTPVTMAAGTYVVKITASYIAATTSGTLWVLLYTGSNPADSSIVTGIQVYNPGQGQSNSNQSMEIAFPLTVGVSTTMTGEVTMTTTGGTLNVKMLYGTGIAGTVAGTIVLNLYQIA